MAAERCRRSFGLGRRTAYSASAQAPARPVMFRTKARAARSPRSDRSRAAGGHRRKKKGLRRREWTLPNRNVPAPSERPRAGSAKASLLPGSSRRKERGRDRDIPQEKDARGDARVRSRVGARRRGRGELEAVLEGA